jgi:peptidoglycan/xylan/chitin deacetylase (PgdA/CDA1 family)
MAGNLVISLDFELHWGVRDQIPVSGYRERLLGVRQAIPALLRLFREREIRATWATVGLLMAESRDEIEAVMPRVRPVYADPRFDPYQELASIGRDEESDPFHYAPSLVREIVATPGQEIGTHTFSHYYGLEQGQGLDTFVADLVAARTIMARRGLVPRAIVFPRNQYGPDHVRVLPGLGIIAFRGQSRGLFHRPVPLGAEGLPRRAIRLVDSYLPLSGSGVQRATRWPDAPVVDVAASQFLRPYAPSLRRLDPLRLARIDRGMTRAARTGGDFHLWWHPHNFGADLTENLGILSRVLDRFGTLSHRYGMSSAHMTDRAETVLEYTHTTSRHAGRELSGKP